MIYRNNTRRFSLLALLLAMALFSNLSFTSGTSARPAGGTCMPPLLSPPAYMPPPDKKVAGWGDNSNGQLSIPAGLTDVTAISAGTSHSLALKSDGTVVGWGTSGGAGAETPPAGLSGVTAISAGGGHSLALKSDGTVVGWGDNTYCQATPPGCVSSPAAISAGGVHSLAMQTTACVQIGCPNSPPAIAAVANTRQQGAPASASTVATVSDPDQSAGSLTVTVNGGASATVTGVTVSGLTNTNGTITATIGASCTATSAGFTLTVTDSASATAMATLNVTVTANTAPTLGAYPNAGPIIVGAGTTVTPATPPSDNVSVASVTVAGSAGFTGSLSVHPTTGVVTVSNAGPVGAWVVTVTVTDNCGATTIRQFTLSVQTAQQAIQALIAQVNALVPSTLTSQKANSLTNKLDSAIKALDAGKSACTHIQGFIDLVNNYIGNGTLTLAQGQPLIDMATAIRAALGCS